MMTKEEIAESVVPNLNQGLEKLLEWAQAAEGFAIEQAPLLVSEILTWGVVKHSTYLAIWTMVSLGFLAWAFWLGKSQSQRPESTHCGFDQNDAKILQRFVVAAAAAALFLSTIVNMPVIVNIYFAPRLYLIQQLSDLVR